MMLPTLRGCYGVLITLLTQKWFYWVVTGAFKFQLMLLTPKWCYQL